MQIVAICRLLMVCVPRLQIPERPLAATSWPQSAHFTATPRTLRGHLVVAVWPCGGCLAITPSYHAQCAVMWCSRRGHVPVVSSSWRGCAAVMPWSSLLKVTASVFWPTSLALFPFCSSRTPMSRRSSVALFERANVRPASLQTSCSCSCFGAGPPAAGCIASGPAVDAKSDFAIPDRVRGPRHHCSVFLPSCAPPLASSGMNFFRSTFCSRQSRRGTYDYQNCREAPEGISATLTRFPVFGTSGLLELRFPEAACVDACQLRGQEQTFILFARPMTEYRP